MILLFCLALGLRLMFLLSQIRHNPIFSHVMMDEKMHDLWAWQIATGQGFGGDPFFRAPGYYGLLSLIYRIFGHQVIAGRILGCVLGSFSVLLILKLGERLGGRKLGMLAGLIAALYWPLIYFDVQLLSPSLEIFLNLFMFEVIFRAREKSSSGLYLAAGVLLGLSAITRPTILSFAPILALWVMVEKGGKGGWKKNLVATLLLSAGALLCVMPVSIYNLAHQGQFVLIATNGGVNFFIGNNPRSNGMTAVVPGTRKGWQSGYEDTHRLAEEALGHGLSEAEVSSYWYRRSWQWILTEPGAWLRLLLHKFRLYWSPHEIGNNQSISSVARLSFLMRLLAWAGFPLLAALAFPGLIAARGREWALLLLFVPANMMTTILFFCNARYRLPVIPVLILLAAGACVRIYELLGVGGKWKEISVMGLASVSAFFFVMSNPPDARAYARDSEANHALQMAVALSSGGDPQERDPGEAKKYYEEVLRLWPAFPEASIGLAGILREEGEFSRARSLLDEALKAHPHHRGILQARAAIESASGQTLEAIRDLNELLTTSPGDAPLLQELGCLQAAVGEAEAARRNLERALAIRPELVKARRCLEALPKEQAPLPR